LPGFAGRDLVLARAPHFAKWQERTGRTFLVVVLAAGIAVPDGQSNRQVIR